VDIFLKGHIQKLSGGGADFSLIKGLAPLGYFREI